MIRHRFFLKLWRYWFLCGLIFFALATCAYTQTQEEYRLGPEDILKIQVYGEDDLTQEVTVADDGTFPYPLIGIVKADGLTVEEVEKEITRRLMDGYLKDPQVMVSIN